VNVNRGGGVKVQVGGDAELACAIEVSVDGGPAVEIRVDIGGSTPLQAVVSTASKINKRPTSFRYQRNTTFEFSKLATKQVCTQSLFSFCENNIRLHSPSREKWVNWHNYCIINYRIYLSIIA